MVRSMNELDVFGQLKPIYGKVIDVGLHTATVRRADQPGYRDVVQLARLTGGRRP